ncbi:MAG TPA: L,D-transpeptidase [Gemmatimonadaceae bacterium]|nr:L,D-transpeptidase [Gemmatimonadaceae bacterium]
MAAGPFLVLGCVASETSQKPVDTVGLSADVATASSTSATPVTADMQIEVDINARQLHVLKAGQRVASHPVAVGSPEWPTMTGQWNITQVVWNPDWNPPDESWAEERKPRESGDPLNPMGRAQLVYDPPRSIHGTNQPSSIGKPVSHGSIRLSNAVITQLARDVMETAGAVKDSAWYRATQQNRKQKQVVDLPKVVPIRVF